MGKIYILFNYQNASKSIPLPSLAHIGESPPAGLASHQCGPGSNPKEETMQM